jgi:plasmid stability protein
MSHIQVKDVPEPLHAKLRRRAERSGKSIRDYVLDLIRRDLARPSREDWLAAVERLVPLDLGAPAADLIRGERESRGRRR